MCYRRLFLCLPALLLLLVGCSDPHGPGYYVKTCTINTDGTYFTQYESMQLPDETFYVSDTCIFTIQACIKVRGMYSHWGRGITPTSLDYSDSKYLVIIPSEVSLYFCASGDLYTCTFGGDSLQNVTPNNDRQLINPSLSNCGRYITMISSGFIHRFDRDSGDMIEFPVNLEAQYALYNSQQDKYYLFAANNLYSLDAMGNNPILLMEAVGSNALFAVSKDLRFFASYGVMLANNPEVYLARIFDSEEQQITEIGNCHTLSFSPTSPKLFYSSIRHGLADIRSYDLESGNDILLTDGIYQDILFLDSISRIHVRSDGSRIMFDGHTSKHSQDL